MYTDMTGLPVQIIGGIRTSKAVQVLDNKCDDKVSKIWK